MKSEDWKPIDDNAKSGEWKWLILKDIYGPKHLPVLGWFENGRWCGNNITSHHQPILYQDLVYPDSLKETQIV